MASHIITIIIQRDDHPPRPAGSGPARASSQPRARSLRPAGSPARASHLRGRFRISRYGSVSPSVIPYLRVQHRTSGINPASPRFRVSPRARPRPAESRSRHGGAGADGAARGRRGLTRFAEARAAAGRHRLAAWSRCLVSQPLASQNGVGCNSMRCDARDELGRLGKRDAHQAAGRLPASRPPATRRRARAACVVAVWLGARRRAIWGAFGDLGRAQNDFGARAVRLGTRPV